MANSLKFENPKINVIWFITFPSGAIIGLLYLIMTFAYFSELYAV